MKLNNAQADRPTGLLAFADGLIVEGVGIGATGDAVGEVCFNTAVTGYQEILTDPSYAAQIVTFTFPHIGNVGANDDDVENACSNAASAALGGIFRMPPTSSSNYRARQELSVWMKRRGLIGVCDVDTRALTARIREHGMLHAVIAHHANGQFDRDALVARARDWRGLEGQDLAKVVTTGKSFNHADADWAWAEGYKTADNAAGPKVVVIDYGVKANILRRLAGAGAQVKVVPADTSFEAIAALSPDGVVLSNGPGDPAATGEYAIPVIRQLLDVKMPILGICLGHQLLCLAAGAKTVKMSQGHHGANHPVKEHATGRVEIVSMNHGFAVDADSLPANLEPTFTSLFDGSNCGVRLTDAPAFSVQHHPEASPGPQDSFGVFEKFVGELRAA